MTNITPEFSSNTFEMDDDIWTTYFTCTSLLDTAHIFIDDKERNIEPPNTVDVFNYQGIINYKMLKC